MNASQFCQIHANETLSGRITFTKRSAFEFIKTYTYYDPSDFSNEMLKRLRWYMVELNYDGFRNHNRTDMPAEKIELSDFILTIK